MSSLFHTLGKTTGTVSLRSLSNFINATVHTRRKFLSALLFGFAIISGWTRAYSIVVHNLTKCIYTTSTHTRISALLSETSLVSRAILVDNTLRIRARGDTIDHSAVTILSTGRWITRINRWCYKKKIISTIHCKDFSF